MRNPLSSSAIGEHQPGMAGRDFRLLLLATLAAFISFAPLLSIAPLWASDGGAGEAGVGTVTGVKMVGTVATQLTMGWWLRLMSLRQMFAVGGVLIGPATALYALSADLALVLPVSALRGAGFAFVVVSGSALVAELVPLAERGRASGRYGVAVGLPMVAFLPLSVWLVDQIGFEALFWASAGIGLVVVPLALAIRLPADDHAEPPRGVLRGSRGLAGPWLLMIVASTALGGAMAFVPLALDDPTVAALTLFVVTAAMVAGRLLAGVWNDRTGRTGGLLPPAVLASALGMVGLAVAVDLPTGSAAVALLAGAGYGLGFGAIQNETLLVMFHRASGPGGTGRASTIWNIGYDAGMGAGSFAMGVVAQLSGMRGAFGLAAVVIALALPVAVRQARAEKRTSATTSPR